MKTSKPTTITYVTNYALMTYAEKFMPLMPARIVDKFAAPKLRHMEEAESTDHTMHPDRFDMVVDWGCVASRVVRAKIAR